MNKGTNSVTTMKPIGSLLLILGLAAIILGFMDRVPTILVWIDQWGTSASWAIKVALVVIGGTLYYLGNKKKAPAQPAE